MWGDFQTLYWFCFIYSRLLLFIFLYIFYIFCTKMYWFRTGDYYKICVSVSISLFGYIGRFYSYILAQMTNTVKIWQFHNCQATIWTFTEDWGNFTIFYSYTTPKIVVFPDGGTYQFTFENSRKAWEKTGSKTTSKQCNKWLGYNYHTLPCYSLDAFERKYFNTRLERYF